MGKDRSELLKALAKGPVPYDIIKKDFNDHFIRAAVRAGHCFNKIDSKGRGVMRITGAGHDAVKAGQGVIKKIIKSVKDKVNK